MPIKHIELPSNKIEALQNYIAKTDQAIGELQSKQNELNGQLKNIDNMIEKHENTWEEKLKKLYNELIEQLAAEPLNIELTDAEKEKLKGYLFENKITREQQIEKLKKLGIKAPEKTSNFAIHATSIAADALGRKLQSEKVKDTYNIIKKVDAIKNEEKSTKEFAKNVGEENSKIKNTVSEIKENITKIKPFSPDDENIIDMLLETTAKEREKAAAKPVKATKEKPQEKKIGGEKKEVAPS